MSKILLLGACGFLGKSMTQYLLNNSYSNLVLFGRNFSTLNIEKKENRCTLVGGNFSRNYDFNSLTYGVEKVFHLISTSRPNTHFNDYFDELEQNVAPTFKLLESCVKNGVKQIVFLSSGGTIYGLSKGIPHTELDQTNPICSYGIQKLVIEKYLQLFYRKFGLDYRIIRLSNLFGPLQNPKGGLGAVTTFSYQAVNKQKIHVFGDGSIIRDYIYIDDAIQGIINICKYNGSEKLFNLGSGKGSSLNDVITCIENILGESILIEYEPERTIDVPYSVVDISKYHSIAPNHTMLTLYDGIRKMINYYKTF